MSATYHIEQIGSVYYLVNQDGTDRLEAGHSEAVANYALVTLNNGVAEKEPGRNLNPYPNGRWSNNN